MQVLHSFHPPSPARKWRSLRQVPFVLLLIVALTLSTAPLLATPAAAPAVASVIRTEMVVALTGATEVPGPGDADGTGAIRLLFEPDTGRICWQLYLTNVGGITAGHIHRGATGVAGPVAVGLFGGVTEAPAQGCVTVAPTLIEEILATPTAFYVNLHNAEFPAGAVRGQLAPTATVFRVRVENISGKSDLPGPFSPGVYAVHDDGVHPLFDLNTPDRGEGLAAIAEDGNPAQLAANLAGQAGLRSSGFFNTPIGANSPAPLFPGDAYEFFIHGDPGDRFSLASMLVQSNDVFVGPGPNGIALFDSSGIPIHGDVTDAMPFWDVGSEMNEAPGMGPNQAPRQRAANRGPGEGGVSAFGNATRALPLAGAMAEAEVTESNGEFTFTFKNVSATKGAITTPFSPFFYATHNLAWRLFTPGQPASPALEALAEDGAAPQLVTEHTGATGIGMLNAIGTPAGPGGQFVFSVTPTLQYPYLTLATMVVESNDAFLAFGAKGIRLLDYTGAPRALDHILADFNRELAVWDAGTEANEVPGVGPNQVLRQTAANTGPADPISGVRIYSDATNDLDSIPGNDRDGEAAGGFAEIIVTNGDQPGKFDVTLHNTSDTMVYPGVLTPVAWAVHSGAVQLLTPGMAASPGLEQLAEDGNPAGLAAELSGNANVASSGVVNTPDGAGTPGPILPGQRYRFSIMADATHRYLSIASMIVPSNDTFFAFEPAGLRLLNQDGSPRSNSAIANDIAGQRLAWDAGTERNQAGAAGPDQAPRQAGPNTGVDEGDGTVRLLVESDGVWHYPHQADVVRITVDPILPGATIAADTPLAADPTQPATTFKVRLENISGETDFPTPFSPGAWAVHDASRPFFSLNKPDRGQGLAAIAEDGNPADLAAALLQRMGVADSGVFNTPVGAGNPGPLLPGQAYEFQFTTTNTATRLSLATMLVQTNDIFAAPGAAGIPLFDAAGNPLHGDITSLLPLWDGGSEMNEAPGMGPNQAPRQTAPNRGAGEGGVSAFSNTTRGLPLAGVIANVMVTEISGTYHFTMTNISGNSGALVTPLAPLFYATHNDHWSLFMNGEAASAGLESLAEDGSPAALIAEHSASAHVGEIGAAGSGPILTGGTFNFSVTPTRAYPYLTLASMIVESNDAFLAFGSPGIALLDSDGNPRSVADILADINRTLVPWDAGTEANEVPGVGPNQAPRQAAANTGPVDPTPGVHIYRDATNDLVGSQANGFADLTIEAGPQPGSFLVTLRNTSGTTVYPGILTPVAWAIHNSHYNLFRVGEAATLGLEALAEDGNAMPLLGELEAGFGVGHAGIQAVADGATGPGPITNGGVYRFLVTPSAAYPYLTLASMIVPSNDTFLAFGPRGIRLVDESGTPRALDAIAADIASDFIAWDAGTERNQAGAAGPDQAPRQAGPNTGADEGDGTVRLLFRADATGLVRDDTVWDYPQIEEVLRATIEPVLENQADTYLFVSSSTWGRVAGIRFTDEDILAYNLRTQSWSKYFDASDVGLWWNDLHAFDLLDDGSILMSFKTRRTIAGLGEVDDSNIVRFIPTALGENTSGSFEFYFDGSDVGLTNGDEDIDALSRLADGRLLISTSGNFRVPGISGRDEDLILFEPDSLGTNTEGDWERYFDGSDVGLRSNREDVNGAWRDPANSELYLTTKGQFTVNGLSGTGADIFICTPSAVGANTACAFRLFWAGADHGFGDEVVDGFAVGKLADTFNVTTVVSAAPQTPQISNSSDSYQDPVLGQDEPHDLIEEPDLTVDNPNDEADTDALHNADDLSQGEEAAVNTLYLPVITR